MVVAAGVLEELVVWRFEFDGDVIVISRRIGFAGISYCNYVTSLPRQRKLTLDLRTRDISSTFRYLDEIFYFLWRKCPAQKKPSSGSTPSTRPCRRFPAAGSRRTDTSLCCSGRVRLTRRELQRKKDTNMMKQNAPVK